MAHERKNIIRNSRRPTKAQQPFYSMKNSHRNSEQIRRDIELAKIQPQLLK